MRYALPRIRVARLRAQVTALRDKWPSNDRTRLIGPLQKAIQKKTPLRAFSLNTEVLVYVLEAVFDVTKA